MRSKDICKGRYTIYEDGRIYSHKTGIFIAIGMNMKGYPHVQLSTGSRRTTFLLHTLLYKCFVGEVPEGYEVDHIDAIRSNYNISNLQLLTRKENRIKSYRQGRNVKGSKNANSKLNDDIIRFIRETHSYGVHPKKLAKFAGVSYSHMLDIVYYKCWKHVI